MHRYKMLTLACEGNPKFSVSKIELNRKSISYSVHTLKRLKLRYGKDAKLFFLIGADSYNDLSSWKEIESALKLATFVAVSRAGTTSKKGRYGINFIDMPDVGISSSLIRRRLKASESIKYLVPENVRNFIEEYGVYG